ncbi:MAG: LytTR family transcriptional regulator [Bacteroidetes bacterium]|nr:MAG: LytTR family transcriptional regulator [Bacteroidota bacterium]
MTSEYQIALDELNSAIERILSFLGKHQEQEDYCLDNSASFSSDQDNKTIWVASGKTYEQIPIDNILYFESDNQYTIIHVVNEEDTFERYTSKGLKVWDKKLRSHHFCRIHRKYLVNVNHVSKYQKGEGGIVILTNGKHLNVSKAGKERFLKRIGMK